MSECLARCGPLPIGLNHRRRHIARIAKRRGPARPRVSAPSTTGPSVPHGIVRACTRPTAGMVLLATGLNDDRRDDGGSERALSLALGLASRELFFGQTSLWGRRRSGLRRCRPAEGHGLRETWRRSGRPDWRIADRRAVITQRIGAQRDEAQENEYCCLFERSNKTPLD
jgi:hypothetical protein